MKQRIKGKALTVAVILLFIGVGIQPAIAKEETQEYTLMVPSLFGIKKQKITLTSEKSEKLDNIFDELHNQLQDVDSVEETKLVYKRTIDNLVNSGLLSRSDAFLIKKLLFSDFVDKFYSSIDKILDIETDIDSRNCFISGISTESYYLRLISHLIDKTSSGSWFAIPFLKLSLIVLFADISFGYRTEIDHWTYNIWSEGWVITKKISDNNSVIGEFRGGLSKIDLVGFSSFTSTYYIGVYFFLGIGFTDLNKNYFLGRAALVDVYEKPDV